MPQSPVRFPPLTHARRLVVPAGFALDAAQRLSLAFNGTNSVVTFGNPAALQVTGPLSVCVFFKPFSIGTNQHIIGKGQGLGGAADDYTLTLATTGGLYFDVRAATGATRSTVQSNTVITAGRWYHACVTWDGTTTSGAMKLYLNGSVDNSNTALAAGPTTTGANFQLGNYPSGTWWFNGLLAEPRVFGRVLSQAEIQALAFQGLSPAGPVGEWLFGEGGGSTVRDTSGNGNNGTLSNVQWSADAP